MRKLLATAAGLALAGSLAFGPAALADRGSEDGKNQVTCGENHDVNGLDVYVGPDAIEACQDSEGADPQGRIYVDSSGVGIDGDADNADTPTGYAKVGSDGTVTCGSDGEDGEAGTGDAGEAHDSRTDQGGACGG